MIDCSRVDLSFMGHSYYGSNIDVLSDQLMLVKENLPADKRPHLVRKTTDRGDIYWEFHRTADAIRVAWHFDE